MTDTLKTPAVGATSVAAMELGILPDVVSIAVGVVTFLYFIIKIKKEMK